MTHDLPDDFSHPTHHYDAVSNGTREDWLAEEGREGEALLHKCCADLGVNFAMALQIVAWAEENTEPRTSNLEPRNPDTARTLAALIKILEYLHKHPSQIHSFAVLYAFNMPLLDDVIGHHNPASYAASIGSSREAVNKVVKTVLREFDLKPRRGMRDAEACKNMSTARKKQLKVPAALANKKTI